MFSLSNFRNINKIFNFQLIIFFAWVAMWISINSGPGELGYMFKDKITFINGMRTIFAIIFSILMIMLAISLIIKDHKQFNKKSIILIIFLIHFVSQIIGLSLNPDRVIDLNNIYLVLYSISTISILFIIQNKNYENLIPFFIYFIIFILTISVVFVISQNADKILGILYNNYSLYHLIHPDIALNYQAQPRITGFSRTLAIINIFLLIIFLINFKKIYFIPLFFIIYIFSVIIWLSQARGAILCYYFSSLILVFLFNNLGFIKKIFIYLTITLFSIIGGNLISNLSEKKIEIAEKKIEIAEKKIEIAEKKIEIDKNLNKLNKKDMVYQLLKVDNSRFVTQKNTSGRTHLWKEALTKYEYKKIFGLGPQGDRFLLFKHKNKYGNNVSNAMLYGLLSGGYPSIICILFIYIYSSYLILYFFIKEKLYKFSFNLNNRSSFNVLAICFVIFFMMRSIIENSFSLFSIDFLITILSLFILEQNKYKKQ